MDFADVQQKTKFYGFSDVEEERILEAMRIAYEGSHTAKGDV
jgi:hypothetical protein